NAERYIGEALNSLWAQTVTSFEVIVVDDASTDRTPEILAACGDKRLKVIRSAQPEGQTKALVRGWRAAAGEYIARLDADDIALPHRLEKQLAYFRSSNNAVIHGSAAFLMDESGAHIGLRRMPIADLEIRWAACFRNPFLHSSVMVRADAMRRHNLIYDERLEICQDYDLWLRALEVGRGANCFDPLIKPRLHAQSISATATPKQAEQRLFLSHRALQRLLPDIAAPQVAEIYRLFIAGEKVEQPWETIRLYLRILHAFGQREAQRPGIALLCRREAARALRVGWRRLSWRQWLALGSEVARRFFSPLQASPAAAPPDEKEP
ncbi:MAG: glycosyltransferase, partial [Planctomycetota bacterium]|nr:glycosyltransferase [Planctomycetota bacterium]